MKSIIAALVMLATTGILTDAKQMNGYLDNVFFQNDSDNCTFSMNDEESPIIQNKKACKMLVEAHQNQQPVCVEINGRNYVIYYQGHDSHNAGEKLEKSSFEYQLVGKVNNVRYHSWGRCYIAVDTGYYSVRNNNVYHYTGDSNLCDRAITAFYERTTVTMIASVDLNPGNANDIEVLIVNE